MKAKYILGLALGAVLSFSSCSDDDKFNGQSATVLMDSTSITVKETTGLFNIPIRVEGGQDGNIEVDVEVTTTNVNGAVEDKNYLVTSKHIIIPANKQTGKIEIKATDCDITNDLSFNVKIKQAKGANVSETRNTTTVTIKQKEVYDRIAGTWTFGPNNEFTASISTVGINDSGYGTDLSMKTSFNTNLPLNYTMSYQKDKTTGNNYIKISLGNVLQTNVGFTLSDGLNYVCDIYSSLYLNGIAPGIITGTISDDYKTITFDKDFVCVLALSESGVAISNYISIQKPVFTRK